MSENRKENRIGKVLTWTYLGHLLAGPSRCGPADWLTPVVPDLSPGGQGVWPARARRRAATPPACLPLPLDAWMPLARPRAPPTPPSLSPELSPLLCHPLSHAPPPRPRHPSREPPPRPAPPLPPPRAPPSPLSPSLARPRAPTPPLAVAATTASLSPLRRARELRHDSLILSVKLQDAGRPVEP